MLLESCNEPILCYDGDYQMNRSKKRIGIEFHFLIVGQIMLLYLERNFYQKVRFRRQNPQTLLNLVLAAAQLCGCRIH